MDHVVNIHPLPPRSTTSTQALICLLNGYARWRQNPYSESEPVIDQIESGFLISQFLRKMTTKKMNPEIWHRQTSNFTRDVDLPGVRGHHNLKLPTVNAAPSRVGGEAALSIREAQDFALPLICLETPASLKGGYPHANHQLQVTRNSGQKELSPPQR